MQRELRDVLLGRLIAVDPQLSLEETLRVVVAQARASRGGVFTVQGSVELLAGCGVTQMMLDRVRGAWEREQAKLDDGRPVWGGSWSVWPVEASSSRLLVYVAAETTLHIGTVRDAVGGAAALLATAVQADCAGPDGVAEEAVDKFLEVTSREGIERRRLMAVLNRHEWNIARVARVLGCNRVTVYKRMRRLGVPRLRVCRNESPASA